MVNKTVVNYLRKYHGKYDLEALKKKIISTGYTKEDVEEALIALNLKKPSQIAKPVVKQVVKSVGPVSALAKLPSVHFPWLKVAGISGVFSIIFAIFCVLFSNVSGIVFKQNITSFIFFLLASISLILFFYGFAVLGKKHGRKSIKVASYMLIVLIILGVVLQALALILPEAVGGPLFSPLTAIDVKSLDMKAIYSSLVDSLASLFILLFLMGIILIVLNILFGLGLMKLEEVNCAKPAGVLHLVGACLSIVGIGAVILIAAFIFEIILLLRASKGE